ncbi:hypothetical protein AV530_004939 [Patagioenas fasciata monilis]|uniref:Uncharacterized protein n=1 Tax=Patagioenas fasciata monilis TaxID=372326 RepID=A0A1V4K3L8_PATFA|nr:hypothetical protein AV530_004939 [Patagioenas fasciata monilis]
MLPNRSKLGAIWQISIRVCQNVDLVCVPQEVFLVNEKPNLCSQWKTILHFEELFGCPHGGLKSAVRVLLKYSLTLHCWCHWEKYHQ